MADGKIVFSTALDNKGMEKDLAKLKKEIKKTEKDIAELEVKKSPLVQQAEELNRKMKEARTEVKRYGEEWAKGVSGADQNQSAAQTRLESIEIQYKKVVEQIDKIDAKLTPAQEKLDGMKVDAGTMQDQLNNAGSATARMKDAVSSADKHMDRFVQRVKSLAKRVFVFTIITTALRGIRDWMWEAIQTNEDAVSAVSRLKGALLTMAQPLVDVIIPAFTAFVNVLADVITVLARLFAAATGTTIKNTKDAAESLYDEQQAIAGVGSAAKKAAGSLASFDEINKLSGNSSSSTNTIKPDFSALELQNLPEWLKNLTADLEVKISEIRFAWEEGTLADSKDAWVAVLTAILGAVIGASFGGLSGTLIGLLLGLAIGLISTTFMDKMENPDEAKELFFIVISSILGAILGTMFGGIVGGAIGLLMGAVISLIYLEFKKGEVSNWDSKDTLVVALSAILGAVLGGMFGGLPGAAIGLLLGALISFIGIEFSEGNYDKDKAIASLRIILLTILGIILGTTFGGLGGGVVGMLLGLTIGFTSVAFDDELEGTVRARAQNYLKIALTTIIGALIGAAFGFGIFGGIVGGVIGLTFGLAVTFGSVTTSGGSSFGTGTLGRSTGGRSASYSLPGFATGAVVPPNREFMAVLGDNKHETEVVSPLSTMKQAMLEALRESGGTGGGKGTTIVFEGELAALARILRPYIEEEGRRVGVSLVTK